MEQRNENAVSGRKTNYRWIICSLLLVATVINYLDRQVLSLTWKDFIAPEFHWTDADYGVITGCFSIVYALGMLFAGKIVDRIGTRKGYLWAIGLWSLGACMHAFCGIATNGIVSGEWTLSFANARESIAVLTAASNTLWTVTTVSVWLFLAARCMLAIGESGNFPCAIKVIAEYFPKKDRGFATGIFNAGAQVGPLIAPFTIPVIARYWGWEMSFLLIGLLGFIWMGFWVFYYKKPEDNKKVNAAELAYIHQDDASEEEKAAPAETKTRRIGILEALTYRQTWAVIFGRFFADAVWWFFLFWAPAFVKDVYHYSSDSWVGMMAIFVLYLISMLSLYGTYLPTTFIERYHMNPYSGRMRAMLIFAVFPLLGLLAIPLGKTSLWYPICIIGVIGAAHQSWSANVYTVVSDMFPKSAIATITGIGGMAGGIGSLLSNMGSGMLFTYARETEMHFLGFTGIDAGYMIVFLFASLAYLIAWVIMKALVPRYQLIRL